MRPQKQAYRHDPDNGVYGDCYRTVIASLLDLDRDEVPHVHEHTGALDMADQSRLMKEWLAGRGLTEVTVAWNGAAPDGGDGLPGVFACMKVWNPGTHYMLTGTSRTGCNHVVICLDDQVVWDPSLTDAGIVGPADDGFYWLAFLAAKV